MLSLFSFLFFFSLSPFHFFSSSLIFVSFKVAGDCVIKRIVVLEVRLTNASPLTQYFHLYNKGKYKPILQSTYKAQDFPHLVFQYKDYAVPVSLASLSPNCSLADKEPGSTFNVPTWDDAAFTDLHAWLFKGAYAPPLPPVREVHINPNPYEFNEFMVVMRPGAAAFASGKTPILAHVRMYRVAATMEIPDLQHLALNRLQSVEGPMLENPVTWLEYLYFGPPEPEEEDKKKGKGKGKEKESEKDEEEPSKLAEPDMHLRGWAKAWLRKGRSLNVGKKCNLELLKDPMHWLADFRKLKTKGGSLVADVDAVEWDMAREKAEKDNRERSRERKEEDRKKERQRQRSKDRAVQAALIAGGHVMPNLRTRPFNDFEQVSSVPYGYPHGRVLEIDEEGRLVERGGDGLRDGRRQQKLLMLALPR